MQLRESRKPVAALAGCAFVTTMGLAGFAEAEADSLFVADQLDSGYLLAAKSDVEGKCGEGKCGESADAKAATEGKCGEGKCGESVDAKADTEGKCGEGKCGASADAKADTEGKCGS